MIYYFSGTGNSRWAALRLAELTGDTAVSMIDAQPLGGQIDQPLGLVFPTYGWDVPPIVKTFLTSLKQRFSAGGPSYIYYATTCGDDTGRLNRRLARCLNPLKAASGWAIIMPESYVALPGFDVDKPEKKRSKLQAAQSTIQTIAAAVNSRACGIFDTHPGILPRTKTYLLGSLFRAFCMSATGFKVDTSRCIACSTCARLCPTGTISMQNNQPTWNTHKSKNGQSRDCTMCLACYHHCPTHAINYRKFTINKGQYTCPL